MAMLAVLLTFVFLEVSRCPQCMLLTPWPSVRTLAMKLTYLSATQAPGFEMGTHKLLIDKGPLGASIRLLWSRLLWTSTRLYFPASPPLCLTPESTPVLRPGLDSDAGAAGAAGGLRRAEGGAGGRTADRGLGRRRGVAG